MKLTLLEIVQDILNDMDGDEVNSISDTTESLQVAQIVRTTYFELMAMKDWPHLKALRALESVTESGKPSHLKIPEGLTRIDWINYNNVREGETRARWDNVEYLYPDEFIAKTNSRNSDEDNVDVVVGFEGVNLLIKNDTQPQYWTSFDEEFVVFDAYDSAVETTAQGNKTQIMGYKTPIFSMNDEFVPDIPTDHFPLLVAEAKSVAFNSLMQVANAKAEQQAGRQRKFLSNRGWVAEGGIRYPDYGRRGRKRISINSNPMLEK